MKAAQHTSGKWTVEKWHPTIVGIGGEVCGPFGPDAASTTELKANARLIAAAPEMLEVLSLARKILITVGCTQEVKLIVRIDSAIAKATGQEEGR